MSTLQTVLVIASDQSDRDYERQLQPEESLTYRILTSPDDAQILALSRSQPIDGILLDLGSDSLAVLSQLKAQLGDRCPPIVVIAGGDAETAVRAFKNGATDYLVRDRMTPADLRLALRDAIATAETKLDRSCCSDLLSSCLENKLDCFGVAPSSPPKWGQGEPIQNMTHTDQSVQVAVNLAQQTPTEAAIQHLNQELANRVAELQTLLDLIPVGVAIATDPTCAYMQNNAYLRQLLGVSPGANISKSAPAEEQPSYRVCRNGQEIPVEDLPMQAAARLGIDVQDAEFDIVLPDGTVRQILSYATPLRDEQNQIRGTIGAFLDITERNQAAAALKASQQHYRELAEAMPQMVWTADATGAVNYWNQRWYEYTGLSEAESMGLAGVNVVYPDQRDRTLSQWSQAIAQGEPLELEYRIRRWDGEYHWFICRAIPTQDSQNQITGWIGTITDIDAFKRNEAVVLESEQLLQRQLAEIEAIYQSVPIGLNVLDTELRFVRINQQLAEMNGLPVEAHLGRTVGELLPNIASTTEPLLRRVLETGEPLLNIEINGETPAQPGVQRTWLEHFIPLKQGDRIIGISTVCEEITERIRVEASLRESGERFRTLADNISQFAWMANEVGWIFWYNQRWFDYTGTTLEEMQGWGWQQVHHPEHVERVVTKFRRCIEAGQPWEDTFPLRGKDGEYRWFLSRAIPVRDDQGKVLRWFGTNTDITARKQAEEALRQSEERYRCLAELIPQMVWTANATGELLDVNQRWKDFTGLSLEQVRALGWEQVVHPEDVPILVQQWTKAVQQGVTYQAEGRMRQANGVYRWHLHQAIPQKNEQGQIIKWFGTATDIEAQKQLDLERDRLLQLERAAREAAERANRIKDEFLTVLSHELRSPLNPILGWAKLLQTRQFDAAKTAEALATIERNARLQTQLIDDLLDIAKILRGKLSLNRASVNLSFVIESAIDTVRTTALAKSVALHAELLDIGQVIGDAARLQQIVWNLLSNAIKFTPKGGRVDIQLERVGNQAQITVKDMGKGISPDFLPYLFELFRQEDASTTRKYGGLGLGLAIVRQLVEAHGGTITADSPGEGMGAIFTVRLPLLEAEPEIQLADELPQPDLNLTAIRILVVDDEPDTRELLAALLIQYGAEVLTVASAAAAVAGLETFRPDVLVSDIGMSEVDGYSLIQQIRALPPEQGGQIPAIALTAYAREVDRQRTLASGYQHHINKPFEPEWLVQAVVALMNGEVPGKPEAGGDNENG